MKQHIRNYQLNVRGRLFNVGEKIVYSHFEEYNAVFGRIYEIIELITRVEGCKEFYDEFKDFLNHGDHITGYVKLKDTVTGNVTVNTTDYLSAFISLKGREFLPLMKIEYIIDGHVVHKNIRCGGVK